MNRYQRVNVLLRAAKYSEIKHPPPQDRPIALKIYHAETPKPASPIPKRRLMAWIIGVIIALAAAFQIFKPYHESYLPYDAQEREAHP